MASKLEALGVGGEAHPEGTLGKGLDLGVEGVRLLMCVPTIAAVDACGGHEVPGARRGQYLCEPPKNDGEYHAEDASQELVVILLRRLRTLHTAPPGCNHRLQLHTDLS